MVKIAVLVSGGGTNLQTLIDAEKKGEIKGGKLSLVVSSKEAVFALNRAENANIKAFALPRKNFTSAEDYSKELVRIFKEHEIDFVVLAGFMTIVTGTFIKEYENKIINVHPALIPSFCGQGFYGLHVHEGALKRGVKLSGATVHFVNEECDGGPIILQKAVEVKTDDTPETLQKRVMEEAEWILLPKAVSLFCEGKLEVKDSKVIVKE